MEKLYNKRKVLKGSFTVEISLIMPLIFMVIIILFYFLLYMYNRGIMQVAVSRGTKQIFYYMSESNEDIERECRQTILGDLEGNLIAVEGVELSINITATKVETILEGRLNIPEIFIPELIGLQDIWGFHLEWNEPRLQPASMIRSGQQIEGIIDTIQGEANHYEQEINLISPLITGN